MSTYRKLLRVPPLFHFAIPGSRNPFHEQELELWSSSLSQRAQSMRGSSTFYTLDDLEQLKSKVHTLYFFSLPEGPPLKASFNQRRTSPTFLTCTAKSAWQDVQIQKKREKLIMSNLSYRLILVYPKLII